MRLPDLLREGDELDSSGENAVHRLESQDFGRSM